MSTTGTAAGQQVMDLHGLGDIDHLLFTAGVPLALMKLADLCLTQPFVTGSILTVDGGTVLA
jgi:hypothetical protein